ncbi:hypothetical protein MSSIH_3180 [Methanosarcina siciliae HI350]|uniref:Uncharacterized protein n=1 Tax=Methanosarcina siciliae HI350 TaxID=1434119 RepID=A0A0E3PGK6_9EURY|nr:hypothetical protein [Methanosarcina siciliae]AKB33870.1 hypothetical protein MSSIH_3180 [Methanosarcina siciliae HI350]
MMSIRSVDSPESSLRIMDYQDKNLNPDIFRVSVVVSVYIIDLQMAYTLYFRLFPGLSVYNVLISGYRSISLSLIRITFIV